MAEKLNASVCVLENILISSQGETKLGLKTGRSVALQFPEDFFQEPQIHRELCSVYDDKKKIQVDVVDFSTIKQIKTATESVSAQEKVPESQTKLHQSILNFKQFNCSLKPLLAMLEFVLQDGSGLLN